MPTYRYRCGGCGEEFEVWQSIRDDPIRTHDHGCGGELVKVLTAAGIVLKGSGFYRNDSRSGAKRGSGDGGGSGEGGEQQPGTKDTKPDGAGHSDGSSSPSSESKAGPAPSGPSPASTSTP